MKKSVNSKTMRPMGKLREGEAEKEIGSYLGGRSGSRGL